MTRGVKRKAPPRSVNGNGLYDMSGNVLEWCWDVYATNGYAQPTTTNPTGPAYSYGGFPRVLRGGDWVDYADFARCASRQVEVPYSPGNDNFGFRCVRGL